MQKGATTGIIVGLLCIAAYLGIITIIYTYLY